MNLTDKTYLPAIEAKVAKAITLSPDEKRIWDASRIESIQAKVKSGQKLTFGERNALNIFNKNEQRKKKALALKK